MTKNNELTIPALYKKILVPLDGSELAAQALPHAVEIARGAQAQLVLVRVVEQHVKVGAIPGLGTTGMGGGVGGGAVGLLGTSLDDEAQRQAIDEAEATLTALVPELRHRRVEAVVEVLIGDPAIQIVDYADTHDIDLIVMSTHGRSGIARWRFGSVANKVLHEASCAVVLVRPSFM